MLESMQDPSLSGNCDVGMDERVSLPCVNGGTCTESTTDSLLAIDAYTCSSVDGFTNGLCLYDYIS